MEIIKKLESKIEKINSLIINQFYLKVKDGSKLNMIIRNNFLQTKKMEKCICIKYLFDKLNIQGKLNIIKDDSGKITKIKYEKITTQTQNKKPPKNIKGISELNKQNKKDNIIRLSKEKLNEKIITNEPIEKEMLKGQEHKEEESKEEKNILDSDNNINISNNVETLNLISLSPRNEKGKIEIKPRETYLKEKMMKMNYSAKLFSSINKSLDNQVKTVQSEILDNQVLITSIPKNINHLLHSPEPLSSGEIPRTKDYNIKTKLKTIKELREEEEIVKNNLKQLLENEKLIKDESFAKLYSLKQSQTNLSLDKILKIEKLKKIESKKNAYMQQINEIEFKINEIINNNNELSRKNKLKSFIDNFERDKEIAEIRAKKYYKESKQISLRMEKDIQQIVGKVKKELEEKEKEDQKKKLDLLEDFKKRIKTFLVVFVIVKFFLVLLQIKKWLFNHWKIIKII